MKIITVLLLSTYSLICFGQQNVKQVLDSVILRAKQTSMYSSLVNWDSLQKEIYNKATGAKSIQDLKPAFTTLLNGLKDMHGSILDAKDYSRIASFTDFASLHHPDKRPRDTETWKLVNDTAIKFESKILPGQIAYLKIIGIPPSVDIEQKAIKIRSVVSRFVKSGINKWIIDLRYNRGGNMHPMVSGIAPIIGDGKVGSLKNLAGEQLFDWEIKASNFIYAGTQVLTLPNEPILNEIPKVAVLTSKWTVSSGEIVATCFKGRPNTKFFGEMTGGYTTNNNWEIINQQIIVNISTGIFCDRNGIMYKHNIPVDVELPFEIVDDFKKDTCIIEASTWLQSK
jgi:carboxyl-terminal processing protease